MVRGARRPLLDSKTSRHKSRRGDEGLTAVHDPFRNQPRSRLLRNKACGEGQQRTGDRDLACVRYAFQVWGPGKWGFFLSFFLSCFSLPLWPFIFLSSMLQIFFTWISILRILNDLGNETQLSLAVLRVSVMERLYEIYF